MNVAVISIEVTLPSRHFTLVELPADVLELLARRYGRDPRLDVWMGLTGCLEGVHRVNSLLCASAGNAVEIADAVEVGRIEGSLPFLCGFLYIVGKL